MERPPGIESGQQGWRPRADTSLTDARSGVPDSNRSSRVWKTRVLPLDEPRKALELASVIETDPLRYQRSARPSCYASKSSRCPSASRNEWLAPFARVPEGTGACRRDADGQRFGVRWTCAESHRDARACKARPRPLGQALGGVDRVRTGVARSGLEPESPTCEAGALSHLSYQPLAGAEGVEPSRRGFWRPAGHRDLTPVAPSTRIALASLRRQRSRLTRCVRGRGLLAASRTQVNTFRKRVLGIRRDEETVGMAGVEPARART